MYTWESQALPVPLLPLQTAMRLLHYNANPDDELGMLTQQQIGLMLTLLRCVMQSSHSLDALAAYNLDTQKTEALLSSALSVMVNHITNTSDQVRTSTFTCNLSSWIFKNRVDIREFCDCVNEICEMALDYHYLG